MNTSLKLILILMAFCLQTTVTAQTRITGTLRSGSSPLSGVNITLEPGGAGTTSNENGDFVLESPVIQGTLKFTYTGFQTLYTSFDSEGKHNITLGEIKMNSETIGLVPVDILAFRGTETHSPVTLSTIGKNTMDNQTGDHAYPELMRYIPGVYASRTGGGVGDAAINIRGFKQENLGLSLNGIPIGSVENGLVYWSNWEGLQEATQNLQIQKGMGLSDLTSSSLGGTINIITHQESEQTGGFLAHSFTDYGLRRTSLSYSAISHDKKWKTTFMGSFTGGNGYADGTATQGWSYYLSINYTPHYRHRLVFTATGSPERHGQRNTKLSYLEKEQKGIRFNKDWGTYDGKIKNLSENFYHKPLISLNHYWTLRPSLQLASSLYFSYGSGGGKWAENFSGPSIFAYRTPSGQIDWDAAALENISHNDIYISPDGDTLRNFSKNAQTLFLASHYWVGWISSINHKPNENLSLTAGIHIRHFKSKLWEEIHDLLGGNYFIDNYAWAAEGRAGRELLKYRGDKVRIDNGAVVDLASAFAKAEYTSGPWSCVLSAGAHYNLFQREDRYNYPSAPSSERIGKSGAELRAGIHYNISRIISVYGNAGFASRIPYYKFVFPNFNNNPAQNLRNESVNQAETGIQISGERIRIRFNAYYVYWNNKSLLSNEYTQIDNQSSTRAMVTGLAARHQGVEAEANYQTSSGILSLTGFVSLGNWKWKNNVEAILFNNENQPVDTVRVYADGLYVGDAPQFQSGLMADVKILPTVGLHASYLWNDRFYADFDPSTRSKPLTTQPYRIPGFGITGLMMNWDTKLFGSHTRIGIACNNIFNQEYLIRGEDGPGHDKDSFRGFWGPGRTFRISLRIQLR